MIGERDERGKAQALFNVISLEKPGFVRTGGRRPPCARQIERNAVDCAKFHGLRKKTDTLGETVEKAQRFARMQCMAMQRYGSFEIPGGCSGPFEVDFAGPHAFSMSGWALLFDVWAVTN